MSQAGMLFPNIWVRGGLPKGDRRRVRSEAKARMRSITAPDTLGATV
jgi:hypothetical protein